jgi:hypothetical protein
VLNFPFSIHIFFLLLITWPSLVMFSFLLSLFVFFCIILHPVLFFIFFFHIFLCNVLVHTWTNIKKDLLMRVIWNSNLRVLWYDGNERPAPHSCAMGLKGLRRWYWKSRSGNDCRSWDVLQESLSKPSACDVTDMLQPVSPTSCFWVE